MTITIMARAARRTPEHPELPEDGPDLALAVAAAPAPGGEVWVHVTFRAPLPLARRCRSLGEAVALLVDAPALGLAASERLVDTEAPRDPAGPVGDDGGDAAAGDDDDLLAGATAGGWVTAAVRLDPPPARPTTLYVRAALRDAVSAPARVDLAPAGDGDAPDEEA